MRLNIYINNFLTGLTMAITLLAGINVQAETIFEGYYKVLSGGVPIGYAVHNYGFDKKTKIFSAKSFVYTNTLGGNVVESLEATSTQNFKPLAYKYVSKAGEKIKTIDATFKNGQMKAVVSDGKTANIVTKEVPKTAFLSAFLQYLMLNKGYSVGKSFNFEAIAEEDAGLHSGQVKISSQSKYMGLSAYKLLYTFKDVKYIVLVSNKGEFLKSKIPLLQIESELVPKAIEATKGHQVPQKILRKLFGSIPTGRENSLRKMQK